MGTHWKRWGRWLLLLLLMGLSSSCLRYDLGLQFDHAHHGQIVQQIRVSERTEALAGPALATWVDDLTARVRRAGGQVQRQGEMVRLRLPFDSGADLTERFRTLFPAGAIAVPPLGAVRSHLHIEQQNRLLAVRHHLVYDLDLRDLPAEVDAPARLGANWLEFHFHLHTPWGLSQVAADSAVPGPDGWRLAPGQHHHIDVTFWLPNWLGLGAVAIASLVLLGYFLKYGLKAQPARRR